MAEDDAACVVAPYIRQFRMVRPSVATAFGQRIKQQESRNLPKKKERSATNEDAGNSTAER